MMSWVKGMAFILVAWSMDKAQWSLWICGCFVYQMRAAKRMQYTLVYGFSTDFFLLLPLCLSYNISFLSESFSQFDQNHREQSRSKFMMQCVPLCMWHGYRFVTNGSNARCRMTIFDWNVEMRKSEREKESSCWCWCCSVIFRWKRNNCSNILQ